MQRAGVIVGLVAIAALVGVGASNAAEPRPDRCAAVADHWVTATFHAEDNLQLSLAATDPADISRYTMLSREWAERADSLAQRAGC